MTRGGRAARLLLAHPRIFGAPEEVGQSPSEERISILRALCGIRIADTGILDLSQVSFYSKPWSWLLGIRAKVAADCNLAVEAMFSYEPTQACLKKQHDAILRACKSNDGRMSMARWPWLDQPAEAEDATRRMSDLEQKNMVKDTNQYLFGSPWIPELLFVVGRLDQAVLDTFSREREEASRSNKALRRISKFERERNSEPLHTWEWAAAATRTMSTSVRVALWLNFSQRLTWWYADTCYMCMQGDPNQQWAVPFSNPTAPMSVCCLCNSRICPWHRRLNAHNWDLLGGLQNYCQDKATCSQRQAMMNDLAKTLTSWRAEGSVANEFHSVGRQAPLTKGAPAAG